MRRQSEGILERPREMRLGHAAHARQPGDRPFLLRSRFHSILRPKEPPQQRWILSWLASLPHEDGPNQADVIASICDNSSGAAEWLPRRDGGPCPPHRPGSCPRTIRRG